MRSPRLPLRLTKPTPSNNTDREERCPEGGALFALTASVPVYHVTQTFRIS